MLIRLPYLPSSKGRAGISNSAGHSPCFSLPLCVLPLRPVETYFFSFEANWEALTQINALFTESHEPQEHWLLGSSALAALSSPTPELFCVVSVHLVLLQQTCTDWVVYNGQRFWGVGRFPVKVLGQGLLTGPYMGRSKGETEQGKLTP